MGSQVLLLLIPALILCTVAIVTAEICYNQECVFHFDVQWTRTMTYKDPVSETVYNVEYHHHQFRIVSNAVGVVDETDDMIGRHVDAEDVITADGKVRNVITINGKFPGPTIEVMEGATVIVHVHNGFLHESMSIHWHGLHQAGTPWMDGVPHITQCPIQPMQTFTYKFTASPGGTHWYHSHLTNQRQDGLYGMFIIHRHLPTLPYFPMIISDWYEYDSRTVSVMNSGVDEMERHKAHMGHHDAHQTLTSQIHNVLVNGRGCFQSHTMPLSKFYVEHGQWYKFHIVHAGADFGYKISIDGHIMRVLASDGFNIHPVDVDVIYIYPGETIDMELTSNITVRTDLFWIRIVEEMLHESQPKHEHVMAVMDENDDHNHSTVASSDHQDHSGPSNGDPNSVPSHQGHGSSHMNGDETGSHRMHGAMNRDSPNNHDEHMMHENKSEHEMSRHTLGKRSSQMKGEAVKGISNPGTMDHSVMDHSNMDHGNMDHSGHDSDMGGAHHVIQGKAILEYHNGASSQISHPELSKPACESSHCKVFNCPQRDMGANMHCIQYDSIKGASETNSDWWDKMHLSERPDEEYVLNFILSGNPEHTGSSINGKKFIHPQASLFEVPLDLQSTSDCASDDRCTHTLDLPANRIINLIFSNLQGDQPIYAHHPVHLHGHSFAILYVGYPTSGNNSVTEALGLLCSDQYCDKVVKSHLHFNKRHTLDTVYNLVDPPIKDTILIPARGFAVVRIVTDNPGYWFLHCHVSQHLMDGMAILINSGKDSDIPDLPEDFPTCTAKSRWSPAVQMAPCKAAAAAVSHTPSSTVKVEVWVVVVAVLIVFLLMLMLVVGIVFILRLKPRHVTARL